MDESTQPRLDNLPPEILIDILIGLDISDLLKIRSTCYQLQAIVDDPVFYNQWYPSDNRLWYLLEISHNGFPQKLQGFSQFYLWYHKYVIYRFNSVRHSYGLLDLDICEPASAYLMTIIKMFEYLESLSQHEDTPEQYCTTVSEMLIGFDVASDLEQCDNDAQPFWELVYGYIKIHCKRNGDGQMNHANKFIEKFYTGSPVVVKFRDI